MKKILVFLLVAKSFFAFGQATNQINYQGAARNSVGNVIPNKKTSIRISILNGSDNGPILYSETRKMTTNNFGLFTIAIGSPVADNSTGSKIGSDLSTEVKFIKVEIDSDGGSNFLNMGAAQLLSVPYALYAGSSSTGTPTGVA